MLISPPANPSIGWCSAVTASPSSLPTVAGYPDRQNKVPPCPQVLKVNGVKERWIDLSEVTKWARQNRLSSRAA